MVRKTSGWRIDEATGRAIQEYVIIGYAETKAEGLKMPAPRGVTHLRNLMQRLKNWPKQSRQQRDAQRPGRSYRKT